jgi:hypothetical protein
LRFEAVSESIVRVSGVFFDCVAQESSVSMFSRTTHGDRNDLPDGIEKSGKLYACDRKTESTGQGLAFSRLVTDDTTLYLSDDLVFS